MLRTMGPDTAGWPSVNGTEFNFSSQRKKDSQIGSQSKSNLMLMEQTDTHEGTQEVTGRRMEKARQANQEGGQRTMIPKSGRVETKQRTQFRIKTIVVPQPPAVTGDTGGRGRNRPTAGLQFPSLSPRQSRQTKTITYVTHDTIRW